MVDSIIVKAVASYLAGVVLMIFKQCSKSCMQLPSILCAALSILSVTPQTFCATDFVSAKKQDV